MTRRLVVVAVAVLVGVAAAGCHDDCSGATRLPCPVGNDVVCVDGAWRCVPTDSGIGLPPPRDLATAPAHD